MSRKARIDARWAILQAVNRFRIGMSDLRLSPYPPVLLGAKHIQRAVRIARHNRLVDDDTLAKAGYRHANP